MSMPRQIQNGAPVPSNDRPQTVQLAPIEAPSGQISSHLIVESAALLAVCGQVDVPVCLAGDDLVIEIVPRLAKLQRMASERAGDMRLPADTWIRERDVARAAQELLRRWKRAWAYPAWRARQPLSMGQMVAIFAVRAQTIDRWVSSGRIKTIDTFDGPRFPAICVRMSCDEDEAIDIVQREIAAGVGERRIDMQATLAELERCRNAGTI
jgi:hypothetical protein